jgi:hypothetical protein
MRRRPVVAAAAAIAMNPKNIPPSRTARPIPRNAPDAIAIERAVCYSGIFIVYSQHDGSIL